MGFFDRLFHRGGSVSAPGPLGIVGDWEPVSELTDEFEGSQLDASKWESFNKNWKGRAPGWFNPENVSVSDGALKLTSRVQDPPNGYPADYRTFSTAFVRSKARLRYGCVEAVVQPADSVTSSAFWLVHNQRATWNEIDVFEVSQAAGHQRKFHMNAHVFRRGGVRLAKTESRPRWVELAHRTCDRAFVVAIERTPEKLTWYVDGRPVRQEPNSDWHEAMFVQFDCETMGNWFGLPDTADPRLPATFKVFGVRTWRRVR